DEHAVIENRRRLQDSFALPGPPHWLRQTHSADVADLAVAVDDAKVCADGAWTSEPGKVLAVLTADCLPVVISDTQGTELAVVHAGWRGLAAGILHNALARFSADLQLHAWLGPAIGPQAFEVGAEVRQAFIERNPAHAASFRSRATAGLQQPSEVKYWADLYALATTELQQTRTVLVSGGDYCTLTQAESFHSHRRDGARSGRMATIAWMDAVHT
ncbi:MAG: peptidoglycan editing factor PgeF, partial [Granulosicoccus sp.]|nr:peptidoglycan editing factor PgeF [Granulosicoccus sp.]